MDARPALLKSNEKKALLGSFGWVRPLWLAMNDTSENLDINALDGDDRYHFGHFSFSIWSVKLAINLDFSAFPKVS